MAAGSWTFPTDAKEKLLDGSIVQTSNIKMALMLNTWTPIGTYASTYEHANANGYTTGGNSITLTINETAGTVTVDISTDPYWTASGGSITARYAVIYNTASTYVICYCLLDSTPADVTVTDGNTLTVAAHASGVYTLA